MKPNTLEDVFIEELRDLYDAEKQLVRALPKMAKAAKSEELAEGLRAHLIETNEHVVRLEKIFGMCDEKPKAKSCKAIRGLIEESSLEPRAKNALQDFAIIESGQKAEHYEIAAYGNLRTLAERLGKDDAIALIQQTLKEEKAANAKLTEVTPAILNGAMAMVEGEEEEADVEVTEA